ncbi:putative mitochondrial protein [Cucumis melo var. makuwa]|uniref:Mitochondrial protein n=1 Tax=Cucumis melo var. makuwa TaxID=1194695 RepID=A0A5A7TXL6_CUCMM|nr:putative mitochondrial protein [Cucumis melo var. makuwa]
MLNSEMENLDSILKSGHNGSHRYGLGFVASASSLKAISEIKFFPTSMGVEHETIHRETGIRTTVKSLGRTCYYCGQKGHIRSNANRKSGRKEKWDARSEQGIFLGYSQNSRAYRVFSNRSGSVMETINVVINDLDSAIKQMNDKEDETPNMSEARTTSTVEVSKADNPSGDPSAGMQTRRKEKIDYMKMVVDLCYTSTIEPSTVDSALKDEYWLNAMQEELLQFRQNNV